MASLDDLFSDLIKQLVNDAFQEQKAFAENVQKKLDDLHEQAKKLEKSLGISIDIVSDSAPKAPVAKKTAKAEKKAKPVKTSAAKPAAKPVAKAPAKPVAKPVAKPTAKPAAKPVAKAPAKPVVKPAVKEKARRVKK